MKIILFLLKNMLRRSGNNCNNNFITYFTGFYDFHLCNYFHNKSIIH